jgi:ribonucleoside-diphosphate reductase alpha chain
MKPRHTAEQSTVKVNKSAQVNDSGASTPRKGFGAAPKTTQEPLAAAATPKKGFGFGSTPQAGE